MNERRLDAIFCDDIRQEVGNKRSYMGVYTGDLVVSSPLPVIMSKLAIVVSVRTLIVDPFKKLEIVVKHGNKVLIDTGDLSSGLAMADQIRLATQPPRGGEEDESETEPTKYVALHIELVLSPFVIDSAKRIRVVATTESGELRSRALRILTIKNSSADLQPTQA